MYLNNLGTPMEIAGDSTRLVENLVDEAKDLLLQIVATMYGSARRLLVYSPDDNDRQ